MNLMELKGYSSKLSIRQFIKWAEENAYEYLKQAVDSPIYRGIPDADSIMLTSPTYSRQSANTVNYYTLWMSNHPAWKAYPKRSHSIICTTGYEFARDFGNGYPYFVVPDDTNKIGIVPDPDIWGEDVFPGLREAGSTYDQINDFVESIHWIFKKIGSYGLPDVHWDALTKSLKAITVAKMKPFSDENSKLYDEDGAAAVYANFMKREGLKNLYELFEYVITPDKFSVMTGASFHEAEKTDHEVWIQGPSALIGLSQLTGDDYTAFRAFCREHGLNKVYEHIE